MGIGILNIPVEVCPPPSEIGTLGAFFQPSATSEKKLVRSDEILIRELVSVLDRQLIAAVESRSVSEFEAVRNNVIVRYVRSLRALYDTAANLVSKEMLQSISSAIVPILSDDLEKQRDSRFGDKLTDQAVFTLWTIQKISLLVRELVAAGDVPIDNKATNSALMLEYHAASVWSQFHLDVLFAAMKFDRPICEPIRETICDGLRASVNAYVIMKDSLSLRHRESEGPAILLPWDKEDDHLLASSMRDLNTGSLK
jgi:hypothetical protein